MLRRTDPFRIGSEDAARTRIEPLREWAEAFTALGHVTSVAVLQTRENVRSFTIGGRAYGAVLVPWKCD
jgi:hypothetical protein